VTPELEKLLDAWKQRQFVRARTRAKADGRLLAVGDAQDLFA
jgi:hypothetical protein